MEKIRLCLGILFCLYCGLAGAGPYEKVVLKNGTELSGYISVQLPGGSLTFIAEKADVYVNSTDVKSVTDFELELATLSTQWQVWAEENPSMVLLKDGKKYLVLSELILSEEEIVVKDSTSLFTDSLACIPEGSMLITGSKVLPDKVRILERGEVIRYLDLSEQAYPLDAADIQAVKRKRRTEIDLSGIVDVIELRSGRNYEGQIIEQVPGKHIRLLKEDGVVEVIAPEQIAIQRKVKLNPDQELIEQVQLLDVLLTVDGEEIAGIITEQNYGTEKIAPYTIVQDKNGETKKTNNSLVSQIRKVKNCSYHPLTDIKIEGEEIWVNRQKTEIATVNQYDSILVVDTASHGIILDKDTINGKIVVEMQDTPSNRGLILLKLTQVNVKKIGTCNVFTYEELLADGVLPDSSSRSVNGTLKLVYPVTREGDYILYHPKEKHTILLSVR